MAGAVGGGQPNAAGPAGLGWRFWRLVPAVGAFAGLATAGLLALLQWVERLAWGGGGGTMLDRVRDAGALHRVLVLLGAGAVAAGVRWVLALRPGGHGGELAGAIWFGAGRLPVGRTVAKAVTSIVVVGLGASLGREAAAKQAGALWAWLLGHWTGLPAPQRRLLSACGAGAGIAAVYNVPLGGAAFALEVLLGDLSLALVPPALLASGIATATAWLFLPDVPTYRVASPAVSPALLLFALLVGPAMGMAAVLHVRLVAFADRRRPRGTWGTLAPLAVFAALGLASIPLPELLGNGKDEVQMMFTGALPLLPLLGLAALKSVATAACLGSGTPGGLFTPTITQGAALGALLERGWHRIWPGDPAGPGSMVAAAAFLAAATSGPVSSLLFIVELTGQVGGLVAPLALAVGGATVTMRLLERRSIYSCRLHLARTATEDATGPAVLTSARFAEVLAAFARSPGAPALAVLDQDGTVVARVEREGVVEKAAELNPLQIATARDLAVG